MEIAQLTKNLASSNLAKTTDDDYVNKILDAQKKYEEILSKLKLEHAVELQDLRKEMNDAVERV